MEDSYTKVKLRKISVLKFSSFLSLVGLVSGLFTGIVIFILANISSEALGMQNLPLFGLILFCFLLIPIALAIVHFILGLISFAIFNLCLKIIKGLDMYFEQLE